MNEIVRPIEASLIRDLLFLFGYLVFTSLADAI